jgi:HK97 family phage major capsid protein
MVGLTARKWGADVVVANDLSDDAVISLADMITRSAGWAFADAEDKCLFLGDGTSTYHGIVGIIATANDGVHSNALYTAIAGNTAFSTLDDADLLAMLGQMQVSAKRGARWFVSPEGKAASLDRLTRAAGGNTAAVLAAGIEQTYAGYPITEVEVMNSTLAAQTSTAGLVILANLDQAVMFGNRRGMTLFTNPYILGRQFQTVLTFSERFDVACPGMGNNTTTAGSAARRKSAAVVLKTPGS